MNASLRLHLGWTLIGKSNSYLLREALLPRSRVKRGGSYGPRWFSSFQEVESVQNGSHTHHTSWFVTKGFWVSHDVDNAFLAGSLAACDNDSCVEVRERNVWRQAEGASGIGAPTPVAAHLASSEVVRRPALPPPTEGRTPCSPYKKAGLWKQHTQVWELGGLTLLRSL